MLKNCFSIFVSTCLILGVKSGSEFHITADYKEDILPRIVKTKMEITSLLNNFNFKFDEVVAETNKGNVIFSPFSIYTALAMVGVGTEQKTRKEIANALGLVGDNFTPLLQMLSPLYKDLSKEGAGTTLDIANKAWVGKNTEILKAYQDTLMEYFNSEMGREDFAKDPDAVRKTINDWVEKKTGHNIKDLFTPGSIETTTQLVIANAIYFKGAWEKKFDVAETYEDSFYQTMEKNMQVEYMFKHGKFSTAIDKKNKLQLLQLPYAGGSFSMVVAIPFGKEDMNGYLQSFKDLAVVESRIKDKTKTLQKWINKLQDTNKVIREIDVSVPKFEIKLGLNLLTYLDKMGVKDLFTPGSADLSAINGKTDLYVSSAFHKAFMKVDEEGTTAAAATGMASNLFSLKFTEEPTEIRLNHPFLFYIIHKNTNAVIFSGKIQNPLETE